MPEPSPSELALVKLITDQLTSEGFNLGAWQYEPPPLTVDFVFDDASPVPIAIELTTLVISEEMAGGRAMLKHLTDPLNELAQAEHWGSWVLDVAIPASYSALAPKVATLVRQGFEIEPDGYTSADLHREEARGTLDEFMTTYREAKEAGIHFLM